MEHNFQGRKGDVMPELTDAFVDSVSERYIELYEHITGETFDRGAAADSEAAIQERIENNVKNMLARL